MGLIIRLLLRVVRGVGWLRGEVVEVKAKVAMNTWGSCRGFGLMGRVLKNGG